MTLASLLRDAAAALDGVRTEASDGGAAYLVGGTTIAIVEASGSASFRLDPAVAAAAQRTPDTGVSDRGPEWVRFSPSVVDGHAADRAVAWLASAARRAGAG